MNLKKKGLVSFPWFRTHTENLLTAGVKTERFLCWIVSWYLSFLHLISEPRIHQHSTQYQQVSTSNLTVQEFTWSRHLMWHDTHSEEVMKETSGLSITNISTTKKKKESVLQQNGSLLVSVKWYSKMMYGWP